MERQEMTNHSDVLFYYFFLPIFRCSVSGSLHLKHLFCICICIQHKTSVLHSLSMYATVFYVRNGFNFDLPAKRAINERKSSSSTTTTVAQRKKMAILMFKLCFRPFDMNANGMRWQRAEQRQRTQPPFFGLASMSHRADLSHTYIHTKNEIVLEFILRMAQHTKFMVELRMSVYLLAFGIPSYLLYLESERECDVMKVYDTYLPTVLGWAQHTCALEVWNIKAARI